MRNFTLHQLKRFFNHGTSENAVDSHIVRGIAVDSRLVKPSNVFFALKGEQTDGHLFIADAAAQGALAAVVERSYQGNSYGLELILVDDVLTSLQALAKAELKKGKAPIIAVTGSVGKTTTKDFITTLLKEKYRVASSPGNSNSKVGLPLSILNHTDGSEDYLILEMGMTAAGHISDLVKLAPPHIAVLTSVELAHACNFASISEIASAKAEIFSHPETTLGILSHDIVDYRKVSQQGKCPKVSFSVSSKQADYFLKKNEGQLLLHHPKGVVSLPMLHIPGTHNLHNFLAACVVADHLHVSWERIKAAMSKLILPERRLEHVLKNGVLFINDSYNASTASFKAAFEVLPTPKKGGKRIAVIGQMMELGSFSKKCHEEVGEAALACVDYVICFGKECEPIYNLWKMKKKPVSWFNDFAEMKEAVYRESCPGDVVLLKGSRTNGLWRIL